MPTTGETISEHLTADIGPAEAPSEPRDYTLDDVPLHLVHPTLIQDGHLIGQSRFSSASPIFAMQLPEGEWLYLSIKPYQGYAFQRAGVIDSAQAHFTLEGHSYELRIAGYDRPGRPQAVICTFWPTKEDQPVEADFSQHRVRSAMFQKIHSTCTVEVMQAMLPKP